VFIEHGNIGRMDNVVPSVHRAARIVPSELLE
jgi:hypothetical protein